MNFYFLNTSESVIYDGLNQKQTINLKSGIRLRKFSYFEYVCKKSGLRGIRTCEVTLQVQYKEFHKIGMAIMNWPERTKDSKTFIVVSKKTKQRQILSVSSLKYQIIPHLSVRGYNILPSKARGEFKSNHRWNCFGGMTTKTIKIWLNLYRWIRNCMNLSSMAQILRL